MSDVKHAPFMLTSLDNLGSLFDAQGDATAARPYYEQAFKIYQKMLGDDHPETTLSLNNWAVLEASANRWDVAGQLTDKHDGEIAGMWLAFCQDFRKKNSSCS